MAMVTITIREEDDLINISCDFDPPLTLAENDEQPATHLTACAMLDAVATAEDVL